MDFYIVVKELFSKFIAAEEKQCSKCKLRAAGYKFQIMENS